MNTMDVTMVRVYLAEGHDDISHLLQWLEKEQVHGFTVFRGIAGMGQDGQLHKASLLALSSALPVVIEFFDTPAQVEHLLEELKKLVKADHIVMWPAKTGI